MLTLVEYWTIRLRGLSKNFRGPTRNVPLAWSKWLFVTHPQIDTPLIPTDSFIDPEPPFASTAPLGSVLMGFWSRCEKKTPLGTANIPWLTWNPPKFPRGYMCAQVLRRTVGALPKGTRFTLGDIHPLCDSLFRPQFSYVQVLCSVFWDGDILVFLLLGQWSCSVLQEWSVVWIDEDDGFRWTWGSLFWFCFLFFFIRLHVYIRDDYWRVNVLEKTESFRHIITLNHK